MNIDKIYIHIHIGTIYIYILHILMYSVYKDMAEPVLLVSVTSPRKQP